VFIFLHDAVVSLLKARLISPEQRQIAANGIRINHEYP
jgi:hypothetical protein